MNAQRKKSKEVVSPPGSHGGQGGHHPNKGHLRPRGGLDYPASPRLLALVGRWDIDLKWNRTGEFPVRRVSPDYALN